MSFYGAMVLRMMSWGGEGRYTGRVGTGNFVLYLSVVLVY